MTAPRKSPPAEPFFLAADSGSRFCLFHAPAQPENPTGAVIYVHPFCEEMNNSRRMAALQSRALAELGYGVLQMDLFGCGDSSGDLSEARWEIWKSDLALAQRWMEDRLPSPVTLWGLRLGATLAMDYVNDLERPVARLVLWHPILHGEAYLTQFWRMKLASEMLSGDVKTGQTNAIRDQLAGGAPVEVAGYTLTPELVTAIDKLRLGALSRTSAPIHWFDAPSKTGAHATPAVAQAVAALEERKMEVHLHLISGPAFWSAPEIGVSQPLLDATTTLFAGETD